MHDLIGVIYHMTEKATAEIYSLEVIPKLRNPHV